MNRAMAASLCLATTASDISGAEMNDVETTGASGRSTAAEGGAGRGAGAGTGTGAEAGSDDARIDTGMSEKETFLEIFVGAGAGFSCSEGAEGGWTGADTATPSTAGAGTDAALSKSEALLGPVFSLGAARTDVDEAAAVSDATDTGEEAAEACSGAFGCSGDSGKEGGGAVKLERTKVLVVFGFVRSIMWLRNLSTVLKAAAAMNLDANSLAVLRTLSPAMPETEIGTRCTNTP